MVGPSHSVVSTTTDEADMTLHQTIGSATQTLVLIEIP